MCVYGHYAPTLCFVLVLKTSPTETYLLLPVFDLATIASHEDVRWAGTRDEPLTTPLEALAAPTATPCWAEIRSRLSSSFFRPGVHWVLAKRFAAKVFQDGGRKSTINVQKTWHNIRRGVEESC